MRRYQKLFTVSNPFGGPPLLVAELDQQVGWGDNSHWVFTCQILGGASTDRGRTFYVAHNVLRRPAWHFNYKRPAFQIGLTKNEKLVPYAEGL